MCRKLDISFMVTLESTLLPQVTFPRPNPPWGAGRGPGGERGPCSGVRAAPRPASAQGQRDGGGSPRATSTCAAQGGSRGRRAAAAAAGRAGGRGGGRGDEAQLEVCMRSVRLSVAPSLHGSATCSQWRAIRKSCAKQHANIFGLGGEPEPPGRGREGRAGAAAAGGGMPKKRPHPPPPCPRAQGKGPQSPLARSAPRARAPPSPSRAPPRRGSAPAPQGRDTPSLPHRGSRQLADLGRGFTTWNGAGGLMGVPGCSRE